MYESATLPAGEYRSVRVILGNGAGRNWWCVVYPPMCVEVSEDEEAIIKADQEEIKENDEDIVFKSAILDRLGMETPQPNEKAKSRLLKC